MNFVIDKGIYPFKNNYFEIENLKYNYIDEGAGLPVIMVHGNPTWSIYYRNLVNALKDQYRCIVPDHIGCGFSDKPTDTEYNYTLSRRIEDLSNFIESLKLDKPITLVVHDWGGYIGMGYATKYPEKIARIVILNTGAFHVPVGKKVPFALRLCRDTSLGDYLVRNFNAFALGASIVGCKRQIMPQNIREAYLAPYNSWQNRIATSRFVQDIPLDEKDQGYKTITEIQDNLYKLKDKNILICWGEKDFVFDHYFFNTFLQYFPDAKVKKYPDCGHYVLEDAGQDIINEIQDFFKENPINE